MELVVVETRCFASYFRRFNANDNISCLNCDFFDFYDYYGGTLDGTCRGKDDASTHRRKEGQKVTQLHLTPKFETKTSSIIL